MTNLPHIYQVSLSTQTGGRYRWKCQIRATHRTRGFFHEVAYGSTVATALGKALAALRWKRAQRRKLGVAS